MSDEAIISVKNLNISHESGSILSNVNFNISKGEFVYLIGKSGAGKTSLLRTLYADRPIDSGEVTVCGFDVANIRKRDVPMLRRKIGMAFQNFQLLYDRNVYDNLYFVLRATGWKDKKAIDGRIMEVLQDVGLIEKATAHPVHLSEGERQRIGIARALINNPDLILADEPTGNLDPITSTEIMRLLTDINKKSGVTMLISSHDFMTIRDFPAKVLICEDGHLNWGEQ